MEMPLQEGVHNFGDSARDLRTITKEFNIELIIVLFDSYYMHRAGNPRLVHLISRHVTGYVRGSSEIPQSLVPSWYIKKGSPNCRLSWAGKRVDTL